MNIIKNRKRAYFGQSLQCIKISYQMECGKILVSSMNKVLLLQNRKRGNLLSLVTASLSCRLTFEKNLLFFLQTKFHNSATAKVKIFNIERHHKFITSKGLQTFYDVWSK